MKAALGAAVIAIAGLGVAAQDAGERRVYVTVADQATKPLAGLTAADFAVSEDGAAREIVSVAPATGPAYVILTVDTSEGSERQRDIPRNIGDLRNGVSAFIRQIHASNPDAQVALWEHTGAARQIKGFTAKTEDLDKEARRLTFRSDPSVLIEGFVDNAKELQRKETGRRVIVAVAFDSSPEPQHVSPSDVAKAVRNAYPQVWVVLIRDRPNAAPWRDNVINGVTQETGGATLTIGTMSALESTMKQLAELTMSQYAVTYRRPAGAKADRIQVAVNRQNVLVAAPKWAPK